MKPLVVLVTFPDKETAQAFSKKIVEARLGACVQLIGPIESTYMWKDELETSQEWLCLIKTDERLYPALEETVKKEHPYEVPEIVALKVSKGNKAYLDWMVEVLG